MSRSQNETKPLFEMVPHTKAGFAPQNPGCGFPPAVGFKHKGTVVQVNGNAKQFVKYTDDISSLGFFVHGHRFS